MARLAESTPRALTLSPLFTFLRPGRVLRWNSAGYPIRAITISRIVIEADQIYEGRNARIRGKRSDGLEPLVGS
jgi:hypothetical protein